MKKVVMLVLGMVIGVQPAFAEDVPQTTDNSTTVSAPTDPTTDVKDEEKKVRDERKGKGEDVSTERSHRKHGDVVREQHRKSEVKHAERQERKEVKQERKENKQERKNEGRRVQTP